MAAPVPKTRARVLLRKLAHSHGQAYVAALCGVHRSCICRLISGERMLPELELARTMNSQLGILYDDWFEIDKPEEQKA